MMVASRSNSSTCSRRRPKLEQALNAKGFVAVNWASVGMVRFFSTFAMKDPSDTKSGKVWTWQGDPGASAGWQAIGFQPVVLSSTDMIPSLQTGMINVVSEPALYAFASRTFDKANHMLDLDWSLLTGATVVKKDTWDRIPPDVQGKLRAIAEDAGRELSAQGRPDERRRHHPDEGPGTERGRGEQRGRLAQLAQQGWTAIRGKVVPAALFDQIKQLVEEYRAQNKK